MPFATRIQRLDGVTSVCGAQNKHGGRCRLEAGLGTDHRGEGACWMHGGNVDPAEHLKRRFVQQRRTRDGRIRFYKQAGY
jgi:hypothetical protein